MSNLTLDYSQIPNTNPNSKPNPNPNPNGNTRFTDFIDTASDFEFSDYLLLEDGLPEDLSPDLENTVSSEYVTLVGSNEFASNKKCENWVKKKKVDAGSRVAFITKSALEIMDDGFKWRKYGKKKVKNSPNPRNYYKCANGGCNVKKRVERDSEDSSFVITTYDGVHNHLSPCVVYYNQTPLMIPDGWTLQASSSHSSSP